MVINVAEDAGALLVRSGLVSASALDAARAQIERDGGTLGEHLVASGAISDDALTEFYTSRLLVPQVHPNSLARLPIRVVATIPSDMAVQLRAIPVALDGDKHLTVAMSDPSDRRAVDEIALFTGAQVIRAVATQMQIAWCLAHYYGHVTELGQRLLQSASARPVQPTPVRGSARARPQGSAEVMQARSGEIVIGAQRDAAAVTATAPEHVSDGVPASARTRSLAGEIRAAGQRAPSIKPPMPDPHEDESGPVITVEVSLHSDVTAPRAVAPRRSGVQSDPPELAARAGEVHIASGPVRRVEIEEPRIIISDDAFGHPTVPMPMATTEASGELVSIAHREGAAAPARTIEVAGQPDAADTSEDRIERETLPFPMRRRSPVADGRTITRRAPSSTDDPDDEVVVLEAVKFRAARPARDTEVGVGPAPAGSRTSGHGDSGFGEDDTTTSVDITKVAAGPGDITDRTAVPASLAADEHVLDYDDGPEPTTAVMSASELDAAIPQRTTDIFPAHLPARLDHLPVDDDGWGPPGTTIPPPLLGAVPGTDDGRPSGQLPLKDAAPRPPMMAPPSSPEPTHGRGSTGADRSAVRALEDATSRLIELVRTLERAHDRDDVVRMMIGHLAESHRRAGFFVVKPGATKGATELTVFAIQPRPAILPYGVLRLDLPSTLQDVVGTRLPYRGPVQDQPSRAFLTSVLGACPSEILLVPIAVRERVVGVLFGEHRRHQTFDDQLALASRAAGMALERILKSRRG